MIGVIDYGMGNVGSIQNMIKKIGGESFLVSKPDDLGKAEKLILPGVGAFDNAMNRLNSGGFTKAIQEQLNKKEIPFLGICLGMQLLGNGSDEGELEGLGLVPGRSVKFRLELPLKVPHMGWNTVTAKGENPLLENLEVNKFYFVHSYHFQTKDESQSIGTANYGHKFTCMIRNKLIFGAQFHPEKSHKYGMQLFKNFLAIN